MEYVSSPIWCSNFSAKDKIGAKSGPSQYNLAQALVTIDLEANSFASSSVLNSKTMKNEGGGTPIFNVGS